MTSDNRTGGPEDDTSLYGAPQLWIYFAVAAPLTFLVVSVMWFWGRKKEQRADVEVGGMERGVAGIEKDIMAQLQRQKPHEKLA